MSLKHLAERGQSNRRIAEILGVDESTIRYHLSRQAAAVTDGRARQQHLAEGWTEAITCYLAALAEGPLNLAGLHDWLAREHGYEGSLRSLQREPPRDCWRLQSLRGWSHGTTTQIFPRGPRACRPDGF